MTKNRLFQPLVLALVLASGFAVVWGVVGMWAVEVGEYVLLEGDDREFLHFRTDGTPCVWHSPAGHTLSRRYLDLEGNPMILPEDTETLWLHGANLPKKLPTRAARGDASWENRICRFADGRAPAVLWYLVTDGRPDGTAYFVGYDSESKVCVGYLGAAGFRDAPPMADEQIPFGGAIAGPRSRVICTRSGFVDDSRGIQLMQDGSGRAPRGFLSPWDVFVLGRGGVIYHADLQNRTVRVVLNDPTVRSAAVLPDQSNPARGVLYRLAVRTDDSLRVLDERGQEVRRYTIPEPAREQDFFTFAETTTGQAVLYWSKTVEAKAAKVEYPIYWVAPDGRYRGTRAILAPDHVVLGPTTLGFTLPSPALLGGYVAFIHAPRFLDEEATTYPQALARALQGHWLALAIAQLVACGFAVLCYRRQVRYGVGKAARIAWPLFVLLLGVPGWIGYRFGRSWPVLEKCPDCGTAAPRDRGDCARCEAEFPRPALKGTEVLA
jgi:hypothetical protein